MDKRERILDAAEHVVRTMGLSGATTRAITTRAGCAEGTLYLFFKGRAALILALFERRLAAAFPLLEVLQRKGDDADPHAVLLDIALRFLRFHHDVGPLLASLFADPQLLRDYRALILARSADAPRASPPLISYLRKQQRRKRIAGGSDAAVIAEMLLGSCFARAFHDNMFGEARNEAADRKFLRAVIAKLID